ncbi:MAG: hypothetical protein LKG27_00100 [Clostridiaceae bacterium]|jgi:hypothetical protein|nr:hypothetical protein [Clostridiaceae bacterium]
MKKIFKLFLVSLIFFVSLTANANEIAFSPAKIYQPVITRNCNADFLHEKSFKDENFITTNTTSQKYTKSYKNQNYNFNGFGQKSCTKNSEFELTSAYIYSKSYLGDNSNFNLKPFLTELNPHAP